MKSIFIFKLLRKQHHNIRSHGLHKMVKGYQGTCVNLTSLNLRNCPTTCQTAVERFYKSQGWVTIPHMKLSACNSGDFLSLLICCIWYPHDNTYVPRLSSSEALSSSNRAIFIFWPWLLSTNACNTKNIKTKMALIKYIFVWFCKWSGIHCSKQWSRDLEIHWQLWHQDIANYRELHSQWECKWGISLVGTQLKKMI